MAAGLGFHPGDATVARLTFRRGELVAFHQETWGIFGWDFYGKRGRFHEFYHFYPDIWGCSMGFLENFITFSMVFVRNMVIE